MSERFQIDLLVGRPVYDSEGRKLGRVNEIRLIREDDHYVAEGLLLGVNNLTERLGIAQPLERLERWLNFRIRMEGSVIYWEQIDSIEEKSIRLKVRREEVQTA
jgi:sporulation protein YlmC with PRC-barrel domain